MLKQLLKTLATTDRAQTPESLAQRLNISQALIQPMLDQLAQQGYLSRAAQCTDGCPSCPLQTACQARAKQMHFWTLTDKGKAAAND
jgi:DNA-binding transcriptional MocR family regulator